MPYDTITFLSDYGVVDEAVGVVKSVIRSIAPSVSIIDLTHDVPPFDVRAGALTLARSVEYLVPGVVLAVVDPTVGSDRRGIAVEVGDGESVLVGPDNGLLAPAVAMTGGAGRVVELSNDRFHLPEVSATFGGRDIFGPAAAHLCNGVDLAQLGPLVDAGSLVPATVNFAESKDGVVSGDVTHIDRYGNLHLNVAPEQLPGGTSMVEVTVSDVTHMVRRAATFSTVSEGALVLYTDEVGMVAVAANQASAAETYKATAGSAVALSAPKR